MTLVDPTLAKRLGVPQEAVRERNSHGFLRRLDLTSTRPGRRRQEWSHAGSSGLKH